MYGCLIKEVLEVIRKEKDGEGDGKKEEYARKNKPKRSLKHFFIGKH